MQQVQNPTPDTSGVAAALPPYEKPAVRRLGSWQSVTLQYSVPFNGLSDTDPEAYNGLNDFNPDL